MIVPSGDLVIDKGNDERESFYILEDENMKDDEDIEVIVPSGDLEKFTNDEFYTTLINRIKFEINLALESKSIAPNKTDDEQRLNANHITNNDILINTLQSEVKFLREEVASKNTIIEIMLNRNTLNDTTKKNINDGSSSSEMQINSIEVNENDTSIVINEDIKNYNMVKNKKSNNKRSMCILSDSMTKDIDTHKLRRGL